MSRTRFTEFAILVDTHYVPKTADEEATMTAELEAAVKEFCSVPVLRSVILCDDVTKLRKKQLMGSSVEIGDKYKRIHVHFVLNLEHQTTIYLKHPDGRTINRVCQEWFNERLGTSCFVAVSLADTRAKNYATKGTKRGAKVESVSIDRATIEASTRTASGGTKTGD